MFSNKGSHRVATAYETEVDASHQVVESDLPNFNSLKMVFKKRR